MIYIVTILCLIPIGYIAGIIAFFAYGLTYVIKGFTRDKNGMRNGKKITKGFIFLGISYILVAVFIIIALYFRAYPIRFM